MSNNRRIFGLGLIAGTALGYWLNTKKGRDFRMNVAQTISEYSDEVSEMAKENAMMLSGNISTAMEESQNWVAGTKGKLKSSIHELADKVEHTVDDAAEKLETGLKKARHTLEENTNKLKDGKKK